MYGFFVKFVKVLKGDGGIDVFVGELFNFEKVY